jgi:hypothetical protein
MQLFTVLCKHFEASIDKLAGSEDPWYFVIAKIVAIPAFLISLWNFISLYFLKLKLRVIPATQIQLTESTQRGQKLTAFNVLFTIFSKGPSNKWDTYKFISADVLVPNGNKINFICRSYIEETAKGQSNASRNIPIAINGGQSKSTTVSFQTTDFSNWELGKYEITFYAINSHGNNIVSKKIRFILDANSIATVQNPDSILTIPSEIIS